MKFRFEYQLKDGSTLSTTAFSFDDIKQHGDFLSLTLKGKKENKSITVNTPEGDVFQTTYSEVKSVRIVFIE